MLGEKTDGLARCVEKKTHDSVDEPKSFPKALPVGFKAFIKAPMTIVMPAASKTDVTVTPYFLKIFFILSVEAAPFLFPQSAFSNLQALLHELPHFLLQHLCQKVKRPHR